jgi:hypothetical protein
MDYHVFKHLFALGLAYLKSLYILFCHFSFLFFKLYNISFIPLYN